jgi:hypothetical protein
MSSRFTAFDDECTLRSWLREYCIQNCFLCTHTTCQNDSLFSLDSPNLVTDEKSVKEGAPIYRSVSMTLKVPVRRLAVVPASVRNTWWHDVQKRHLDIARPHKACQLMRHPFQHLRNSMMA